MLADFLQDFIFKDAGVNGTNENFYSAATWLDLTELPEGNLSVSFRYENYGPPDIPSRIDGWQFMGSGQSSSLKPEDIVEGG